MKSVPALLFFKPMKEEPTEIFEKPTFEYFSTPLEGNPAGWYCYDSEYPDEGAILYKQPFRPGEKCYVREAWARILNDEACIKDEEPCPVLCEGCHIEYKADTGNKHPGDWPEGEEDAPSWRSPVTMPQWAARRFVTVLSCTPARVEDVTKADMTKMGIDASPRRWWEMKFKGKEWAWRIEGEGVRG